MATGKSQPCDIAPIFFIDMKILLVLLLHPAYKEIHGGLNVDSTLAIIRVGVY